MSDGAPAEPPSSAPLSAPEPRDRVASAAPAAPGLADPGSAAPGVAAPESAAGLPEALAEPTRRVGPRWVSGIALVNVGVNTAIFAALNQLIPLQATVLSGAEGKEATTSLAATVGVLVAMVANPIVGALSDRTTSRWGRRTPWMVLGAVVAVAMLMLTAGAPNVAVLCLGWAGAQAGLNAMSATVTATVPDRVPVDQRGLVGGVVATGITVGILIGSAIGMIIAGNIMLGYVLACAVLLLCLVPYLLRRDDPVLPVEARTPFSWGEFLSGFWISPRKHPDFAWAWLGRLLMMTATQLTIIYLLFFLTDVLHHENPPAGVFVLTAIYAFGTLASAAIAGRISDRVGRRPMVFIASVLIAVAALLMAASPLFGPSPFGAAAVAAAILGIGNGAYLGVDFALLTQVLPEGASRGKDMGIINIAASLPQIFAAGLALLAVRYLGGYTVLFVSAGLIGLLGAASVYRIKSVR